MVKQQSDDDAVHSEPLLNMSQTARKLNLSRSYIYRLIQEGWLPVVRFGKLLRFRPEDVEALIGQSVAETRGRKGRKKKGTR
jgi:excisionase family DNA binding protein